uniref:Uncharacterized protein n=2 Tax=Anguilla anguilla TaxID=7936 RepID=A0A0E9QK19_ANGAN
MTDTDEDCSKVSRMSPLKWPLCETSAVEGLLSLSSCDTSICSKSLVNRDCMDKLLSQNINAAVIWKE